MTIAAERKMFAEIYYNRVILTACNFLSLQLLQWIIRYQKKRLKLYYKLPVMLLRTKGAMRKSVAENYLKELYEMPATFFRCSALYHFHDSVFQQFLFS